MSPKAQLHFLDMPFYETGRVRKKPLSEEDIQITVDLLRQLEPHQIYAAGDLSDPHGTHRTCLSALFQACQRVQERRLVSAAAKCGCTAAPGRNGARTRSRWPCRSARRSCCASGRRSSSTSRRRTKRCSPGPIHANSGNGPSSATRATAKLYDKLGLAEYEAIEGFVRWKGELDAVL